MRTDWPISDIGVEGWPVAAARAIHWPIQNTVVSYRPDVIICPRPVASRACSAARMPITP